MDKERYCIFEVTPPRGGPELGFGPLAAHDDLEARVYGQDLTLAEVVEARQEPNRVVAEVLPTTLIGPLAGEATEAEETSRVAWGVEAVGAGSSDFTGKGIKVAVLDTGVDEGHEAFLGLHITPRDFTSEGREDRNGHGTHCAGIIAGRAVAGMRIGIATGVTEMLAGKVLGRNGGTTEGLVQGIQWAVEEGAVVVSMSVGIDFPGRVQRELNRGLPLPQATSRTLEAYRQNLRLFGALSSFVQARNRALVVCAAGNESARGAPQPYTIAASPPATTDGFLSVGALMRSPGAILNIAPFSNTNVSVVAPGVGIRSAKPGGGLAVMSGTSMATPHVAGVAALWAEQLLQRTGEIDLKTLTARLVGTSQLLPTLRHVDAGAGLVCAPQ